MRRLTSAALVAALVAAALVAARGPAAAATCANVFPSSFAASLHDRYPNQRFTAAVYDTRTGCWYHLNRGLRVTTASVIKAEIMGTTLLRAQREHRGLTTWERDRIRPMIRYSFNNPQASDLYFHGGGVAGLEEFDALVGANATTHTPSYGATESTAEDRTKVALGLLYRDSPLSPAMRAEAWHYMGDVHPTQRWGISAGVPIGWAIAQKNGFYPRSNESRWRIGSSGFVRDMRSDNGYAITVMTDRNPDHATGQRIVEEISRRVADVLIVGPQARRPVDRARCVATAGGETWTGVTARLGLPSSRAGEVRTVAGGNPSPLSGQRACSPDLKPESTKGSQVNGTYVPVVGDFTCDGHDDVHWYGPGGAADAFWRGGPGTDFTRRSVANVTGTYVPVSGDFDGNGCSDIFWFAPGAGPDRLWSYSPSGLVSTMVTKTARGAIPFAGDFDGDGRDDIFWYRPGAAPDQLSYGTSTRGTFANASLDIRGVFTPLAGDFDGDGRDDIVWYGVGGAPDSRWWSHNPGRGRASFDSAALTVNGAYRPIVAKLGSEANVADDATDGILWFGPTSLADVRWDGEPAGSRKPPFSSIGDYLPFAVETNVGHGVGAQVVWYGPGGLPDARWVAGTGDAVSTVPLDVH